MCVGGGGGGHVLCRALVNFLSYLVQRDKDKDYKQLANRRDNYDAKS